MGTYPQHMICKGRGSSFSLAKRRLWGPCSDLKGCYKHYGDFKQQLHKLIVDPILVLATVLLQNPFKRQFCASSTISAQNTFTVSTTGLITVPPSRTPLLLVRPSRSVGQKCNCLVLLKIDRAQIGLVRSGFFQLSNSYIPDLFLFFPNR